MSVVKPVVFDKGFQRPTAAGDLICGGEILGNSALTTVGAGTLTAAIVTSGYCVRTGPTGAYTDTTDTATNIVNSLIAQNNGETIPQGTTFKFRHINTVAYAMTLAAGTNVTLGTVPATTIAASGFKDYLVTVTCGAPEVVIVGSTTSGNKILTGMTAAQTKNIKVGMAVTGTGIGASAVVTSVQPGVGCNVSVNSTATADNIAITFSPTVRIDAISMG